MATLRYVYQWDKRKDELNLYKHGIDFKEAMDVFLDPLAMTIYDEEHSDDEERWITIGRTKINLLLVVHTYFELNDEQVLVRIISARKPTKKEVKIYSEGLH